MITQGAKLSIRRIPLSCLVVTDAGLLCSPEKFAIYLKALQDHPDMDLDPLLVNPLVPPSTSHPGIFAIKNGKHRFCSTIIAGRIDMPCIVEEPA
jgi:hypothetical protein